MFLIPPKRDFQRRHRMVAAWHLSGRCPDRERNRLARRGREGVAQRRETPRHQREKIAWLRPRVGPFGEVTPVGQRPAGPGLAVRQQHGIFVGVGFKTYRVARQDIGPIDEESDPPEALRLALRAQVAAAEIKAHQDGVRLRRDLDDRRDRRAVARKCQSDPARRRRRLDGNTVDGGRDQRQVLPVELERCRVIAVADNVQCRVDPGHRCIEFEPQRDFAHEPRGRSIVRQANGRRRRWLVEHGVPFDRATPTRLARFVKRAVGP